MLKENACKAYWNRRIATPTIQFVFENLVLPRRQSCSLHPRFSLLRPSQLPLGGLHVRVFCCVPPPQVTEQELQEFHLFHTPLFISTK